MAQGAAHKRFRNAVHRVALLQAVTKRFIHRAEEALGCTFWGDVGVPRFASGDASYNEEAMKEQETSKKGKRKNKGSLSFDSSLFKSQYEFTFPEKAIEVALRRPEQRSEQDIRFIRSMMMGILSFRRYSSQMQLMLARVVYYRRFGRGRVIVRKGHRGDSFYFVFSGVIAVTQDVDGSSALLDPEPILLHKGASFGEVALLKDLRRNATVVCMEETEFLVVDRMEFFENKLDQELQKELKYRFQHFRSLDLFSSWSDKSLETLADHCKAEECHHSQVMVKDTHETKNIIFVTKGRCEVLRLVHLSQCPSFLKWIKQHEAHTGKPILGPHHSEIGKSHRGSRFHGTSFSQREEPNLTAQNGDISDKRPPSMEDRAIHRVLTDASGNLDLPRSLMAGVYLRIDTIHPGQYFRGVDVDYIESCLERDSRPIHEPSLTCLSNLYHKDPRSMVIISQGAEVIRVKLDKFSELSDLVTLKKLKEDILPYPRFGPLQ
ncbi:cyclic nucleotide-binding domain-containing protein 2 isoform X2 [Xenopus tropicalis]|uniref:Cyclic nucleotide-binding domain-containing protein 2 n=1 Tax=Xenopus tropicalis TaxID=8364 RepID=A0A8J1JT87_XENTR|nr:cyclic nucleotide-binding domain-containing protein 2 isoform X2 [Xenopus tropicalis]